MTDSDRDLTKLTLTVDKEVIKQAKIKSVNLGMSLSKVIERFLIDWIKK